MVQIAGNAPPQGTVGDLYAFTFTAAGDNPASQWVGDGTLPSGLQLDPGTGSFPEGAPRPALIRSPSR